jgi:hypothetical protein
MAETPAAPKPETAAPVEVARPSAPLAVRDVYQPRNLKQAMWLSEYLAGAGLCPTVLRGKPKDVFLIIATGADLGLSPTEAFRALYVFNGHVGIYTAYLIARVLANSAIEYFMLVESTATRATWEAKRKGQPKPVRISWTIEEAKAAGLLSKDTWKFYAPAMLRWRSGKALADAICPEAAFGLPTAEEINDMATVEALDGPHTTIHRPDAAAAARLGQQMEAPNGHSNGKSKDDGHDPVTGEVKEPQQPVVEPDPTQPTPQEACDAICEELKIATTEKEVRELVAKYKKLPPEFQAIAKAEAMARSEAIKKAAAPPAAAAEPGSNG